MKKIQDKVLIKGIKEIIETAEPDEAAQKIVKRLMKFQDAGGLKVCQPEQKEVF